MTPSRLMHCVEQFKVRFEEFAYAAGVLDLLFHPVEHLHTLPEVCTSKLEAVALKKRIL